MRPTSGLGIAGALLALLLSLLGSLAGPSAAAAESCPNEARRLEQGTATASLPDCRAFELVSEDGILAQDFEPAQTAEGGGGIAYYTPHPSESARSSTFFYLAKRGASGWSVGSAAPQDAPAALLEDECEQNVYFSPDLTLSVNEEGWFDKREPAHCKRNSEVLVPGEPLPYRNVFLHDVASDTFRLLNLTPEGVVPANAKFQDASDDFSRIVFSEGASLIPGAPAGYDFYVWAGTTLRLLTILPDGSPAAGELVEAAGHWNEDGGSTTPGSGFGPLTGAMSADGSRVFFYAGGNLYLRRNPERPQSPLSGGECTDSQLACTVQIDLSHGPGPSGGGVFAWASDDGSRVFFTAVSKLTPDAAAEAGKPDLYEYAIDSRELTDLTAGGEAADVRGVSGGAEDGTYLYFVANGALAAGASPGTCTGASAAGQACNLYVAHNGSIRFIASLPRADSSTWRETFSETDPRHKPRGLSANTSPSGAYFAFGSTASLTGYDNHDLAFNQLDREIFLYEAEANGGAGALSCVSCIPDGTQPKSSTNIVFDGNSGSATPGGNASWKASAVLDSGQVLFDSEEPLAQGDLNGRRDVYEYEGGQHHLISSGSHAGPSRFMGASANGVDLFFRTAQPLLAEDTDGENASLYDARIGGGFPQPPPPVAPCASESCRAGPAAQLPTSTAPATAVQHRAKRGKRPGRRRCPAGRKRRRHGCKRAAAKPDTPHHHAAGAP